MLDIQVKPGFLDKWYGDVEAEYRTKDHYRGKLSASRLSAKNPQMLYFQANDVNQKVERTSAGISNSEIDKYGKGQFGAYNYEHDWMVKGLDKYQNNHFYVTGSLGHTDGWGTTYSTQETFLPDADHTFQMSRNRVSNHSLAPKLMADLFAYSDKSNLFKATATLTFEKCNDVSEQDAAKHLVPSDASAEQDIDALMGAKPGDKLYSQIVNRSRYYSSADVINRNLDVTFNWTHFYGQAGRTELSGGVTALGRSANTSYNRQFEYPISGNAENLRQYFKSPGNSVQSWVKYMANMLLAKNVGMYVYDQVKVGNDHKKRDFYSDNQGMDVGGIPTSVDASNSMDYRFRNISNELYLYLWYQPIKGMYLSPSVKWTFAHEKGDMQFGSLDSTIVRNVNLLAPSFSFKWNIGRANTLTSAIEYAKFNNNMYYKFGWVDAADPMLVEEGDSKLKHMSALHTNLYYSCVWFRKQLNLQFGIDYMHERNPMSKLYHYDTSTGAYRMRITNDKSNDVLAFVVKYDHSLGAYWRLQNDARYTWSRNYGYMTLVDDDTDLRTNRQTNSHFQNRFQASYEAEKTKFGVVANLDLYGYRYTESSYNSNPVSLMYGAWTRLTLAPFELYMDICDQFRSGYKVMSMNRHRVLCNASVEYRFCRNKCRLTLAANDIFNKDNNFSSDYSAFERSESWYEKLHHYVSLTFAYRFDAKAKK